MRNAQGRHAATAAVVAAAALVLGVGGGTARAATARIVFVDDSAAGDLQVFTIGEDGADRRQLTHYSGRFPSSPSWSPGQTQIAFLPSGSTSSVYTMRSDGSHIHRVPHTQHTEGVAWSPKGNQLAVSVAGAHNRVAIYTIGVNGTHRRQLTPFQRAGNVDSSRPAWSPNGKSIVYGSSNGIVRMQATGRHRTILTHSGSEPTWSPDGQLIAFEDDATAADPSAQSDIYTIRADGTRRRNVTASRPGAVCTDDPGCARQDEWPSWNPSGGGLLFDETSDGGGPAGIFTVNPDGTAPSQLSATGEAADW